MSRKIQRKKAEAFLQLHTTGKLLILPNIWNPIGARVLEAKGYPAVATASAAVSASLGYADGEKIRLESLLEVLARIVKSVDIPVTADIESGYARSIRELQSNIGRLIDTGIVGINIEDSIKEGGKLRSLDEQCERISEVRKTADKRGIHLVINARVDSFVTSDLTARSERVDDAVVRAKAYSEAGSDCIYPMGPGDEETLMILRKRISAPINILATAPTVPLSKLQEIGINRVSSGPFLFRACLAKIVEVAEELKSFGSYDSFVKSMISPEETSKFLIQDQEPR